jgi:tetratricopeptide (TPR) repeat protein
MRSELNAATVVKLGIAAAVISFGSTLALAASGGGNGGSAASTPSCPRGEVYNSHTSRCSRSTSALDDKDLYRQGRDLALAGRYREALTALNAVKKPDSMTLTMIGYSTRKLGNYDGGLAYYAKALALDPNNVNTHEYLGEAYAEKGSLDLAKAELVKVSAVCGTTCEQYQDLAKAIAGLPDRS